MNQSVEVSAKTDPGTDPATGGTGSPTHSIFHSSQGAARAWSLAGVPRAGSLATPTEGATTEVTAEAAAAVPAEEACPEGVRGRGGKHHPLPIRNLLFFSLRSHPTSDFIIVLLFLKIVSVFFSNIKLVSCHVHSYSNKKP
jgi:hypothetical protein